MPGLSETYVRARIDRATKKRAASTLNAMGLSVSDAIRLLMRQVARERRLPLDISLPNAESRKAKEEMEAGGGRAYSTVDELMAGLHADD